MKKIILAAICAVTAASLSAQDVTDALRFSQIEYYGTARSMAMGNAFTALGGDIGSIHINPAGSAVNNYSQVAITPSVNILAGSADYSSVGNVDNSYSRNDNSKTRFTLPNIGVVTHYNTGRKTGLKSISFGIVGSATSFYNENMLASGINGQSSYMGYLSALASADQLTTDELGSARYGDMDTYYWPAMVAYRSGMINSTGDGNYMSPAEGYSDGSYSLNGELDQSYGRVTKGSKYDMVFNFGMNFNDKFYFGANFGIVALTYKSNKYISEVAVDYNDFPCLTEGQSDYFKGMRFREAYSAEGSGVYAKVGFIAIPAEGLRVGAAIQTPTANYITEHLWYSGYTDFQYASGSETINANEEYVYEYRLISPYRVNAGIAYTIPGFGLISADYEMADYSTMKFKETDSWSNGYFDGSNQTIKDYAGVSHMLRIGAEYIPIQGIALRAGYNLTTTPERYLDENGEKTAPSANKHTFSFGVGYQSDASFFCDFAVRCISYPYEYIYPYPSYDDITSPEIRVDNNLWNIALTLGWRF